MSIIVLPNTSLRWLIDVSTGHPSPHLLQQGFDPSTCSRSISTFAQEQRWRATHFSRRRIDVFYNNFVSTVSHVELIESDLGACRCGQGAGITCHDDRSLLEVSHGIKCFVATSKPSQVCFSFLPLIVIDNPRTDLDCTTTESLTKPFTKTILTTRGLWFKQPGISIEKLLSVRSVKPPASKRPKFRPPLTASMS